MAEMLNRAGYQEMGNAKDADLVIVNTCGFIQPAREESLNVLNNYAQSKGKGQKLIAAGCLSEREKQHLLELVPGLDAAFGTRRWAEIVEFLEKANKTDNKPFLYFPNTPRLLQGSSDIESSAVQGASAYLKIADGCDRNCAFCAIPIIKGPMLSRPIDWILNDAQKLQIRGIKEIVLIAQDTTAYGRDFGLKDGLTVLLKEMVNSISEVPWIRLMYAFPGAVSDALIRLMAESPRILPYLDIPLQHAHPAVLKRMHRLPDVDEVREMIRKMRELLPDLALHSTFITGFPGETDHEFQVLADFLEEIKFDHIGFFPYYHETDTAAYQLKDLPAQVKEERLQQLAAIQEKISLEKNNAMIGKEIDVLVEGVGDGLSVGRSYRDAPEIDGLVMIQNPLPTGEIVRLKVTGALVHDLIAEVK